jgi:hypothetical protein
MHRKTTYWLVVGAAAVLAVGSMALYAAAATAASTAHALPAYVVKIAEQQSKENGDPIPTRAVAVDTTRGAAMAAAAAGRVDGSMIPVWFVVMDGHFTDHNARVPPGAPLPTGRVIAFTINQHTHHIMDFGIGDRSPNLASLGTVTSFSTP